LLRSFAPEAEYRRTAHPQANGRRLRARWRILVIPV
jgi:hypothetical protein